MENYESVTSFEEILPLINFLPPVLGFLSLLSGREILRDNT
jgi:hypothetical protein